MFGYKGFEKGLICRGKQYKEDTIFEEDNAEICKSGMHFCIRPFEVLKYYDFVSNKQEINEFATVESLCETTTDDNEKFCTKKLKIKSKISISDLVDAEVEYILAKVKKRKTNTGKYSASTNTGDYSASTNTGDYSASTVNGKKSVAIAIGRHSKAKGNINCWTAVS